MKATIFEIKKINTYLFLIYLTSGFSISVFILFILYILKFLLLWHLMTMIPLLLGLNIFNHQIGKNQRSNRIITKIEKFDDFISITFFEFYIFSSTESYPLGSDDFLWKKSGVLSTQIITDGFFLFIKSQIIGTIPTGFISKKFTEIDITSTLIPLKSKLPNSFWK
jgi:hypothetical protein